MHGMPSVRLFFTDNPKGDTRFFPKEITSVKRFQDSLNSGALATEEALPEPPYDPASVKIESDPRQMNRLIHAVRTAAASNIIGFDLEWKPLYRKGMGGGDKVAVMQICYVDKSDKHHVLILLTYRLDALPEQVVLFLMDQSFIFVGCNVTGDYHKIGRDFNLTAKTSERVKQGIINLGKYARVRDVVQCGTVGLGKLCELTLRMSLDKGSGVRFSNWNAKQLDDLQKKYAALDAIVSRMVYMELREKPDLTERLKPIDVEIGMKVDVVPKSGSVACMATRGAIGTIVDDAVCISPIGISPKRVRPGDGCVSVKIEKGKRSKRHWRICGRHSSTAFSSFRCALRSKI